MFPGNVGDHSAGACGRQAHRNEQLVARMHNSRVSPQDMPFCFSFCSGVWPVSLAAIMTYPGTWAPMSSAIQRWCSQVCFTTVACGSIRCYSGSSQRRVSASPDGSKPRLRTILPSTFRLRRWSLEWPRMCWHWKLRSPRVSSVIAKRLGRRRLFGSWKNCVLAQ